MYLTNIKHLNHLVPPRFIEDPPIFIQKNNTPLILNKDFLSDLFNAFYIKYLILSHESSQEDVSIRLSSIILRTKYGGNYKLYVDYLVDEGYIRKTVNYLAGSHCNTYVAIGYKFEAIDLIEYKNTNDKLIFYYNRLLLNSKSDSKIYSQRLMNSIKSSLKNVNINHEKALEYLDSEFSDKSDVKYLRNCLSIKDINDSNLYLVSDSHGRIHTNFTVLKKEIKHKFITIDGENVMEKDIANSQPLFFLYLLSEYLDDSIDQTEIYRFFKEVSTGVLYDNLALGSGFTRSTIKRRFFKYLFGREKAKLKEFNIAYPSVSEFLESYKFYLGDYRKLSHELQLQEGHFIFNGVCSELSKRRIKFFTVHDSICVKGSDFDVLDSIFENKLKELKLEIQRNIDAYFL